MLIAIFFFLSLAFTLQIPHSIMINEDRCNLTPFFHQIQIEA
jgi:hypothetical protein